MKNFIKKFGALFLSLALILVIVPVATIFAGCGQKDPDDNNPPAPQETSFAGNWEMYQIKFNNITYNIGEEVHIGWEPMVISKNSVNFNILQDGTYNYTTEGYEQPESGTWAEQLDGSIKLTPTAGSSDAENLGVTDATIENGCLVVKRGTNYYWVLKIKQ